MFPLTQNFGNAANNLGQMFQGLQQGAQSFASGMSLRDEMRALPPNEAYDKLAEWVKDPANPLVNDQTKEFFNVLDTAPPNPRVRAEIQNGLAETFAHNDEFARMMATGGGIGMDPAKLEELLNDTDRIQGLNMTPAEFVADIMGASAEAAKQGNPDFQPMKFQDLTKQFQDLDKLIDDNAPTAELLKKGKDIQGTLNDMGLGKVQMNLPDQTNPLVLFNLLLSDPNAFGTKMVEMMGLDPALAPEMTNLMQGLSQFMANGPIGKLAAVMAHYYPGMEDYVMGLADEFQMAQDPQAIRTVDDANKAIKSVENQQTEVQKELDTVSDQQKNIIAQNNLTVSGPQIQELAGEYGGPNSLADNGIQITQTANGDLQITTDDGTQTFDPADPQDRMEMFRIGEFREAYSGLQSITPDAQHAVDSFGTKEGQRQAHLQSLDRLKNRHEALIEHRADLQFDKTHKILKEGDINITDPEGASMTGKFDCAANGNNFTIGTPADADKLLKHIRKTGLDADKVNCGPGMGSP